MPEQLRATTATPEDLDLMVGWAAQEGWNPGLHDAEAFLAADPGGFLVGRLGDEPVSCISVVRYGEGFGFLGFYIVVPDRRGQGHGIATWRAGLELLGERVVGLDGVVEQQPAYRRSGFVLEHRNVRYGGAVTGEPVDDPRLRHVTSDLLDAVLVYDTAFFAGDRSDFLRAWLDPSRRTALALLEDGRVRGYGVVRRCLEGAKIGPLFADSEEGADLLFRGLVAGLEDGPVFLDCPEPVAAAVALATRHGLEPVFETARMYRGPIPELPWDRTYGITTFELG